MEQKSLFTDSDSYTAEAELIADEINKTLKSIIDKYGDQHSVREIGLLMMTEADFVMMQAAEYKRAKIYAQEQLDRIALVDMTPEKLTVWLAVAKTVESNYGSSKLLAIKGVREMSGCGLRDAKEWVEKYLADGGVL